MVMVFYCTAGEIPKGGTRVQGLIYLIPAVIFFSSQGTEGGSVCSQCVLMDVGFEIVKVIFMVAVIVQEV